MFWPEDVFLCNGINPPLAPIHLSTFVGTPWWGGGFESKVLGEGMGVIVGNFQKKKNLKVTESICRHWLEFVFTPFIPRRYQFQNRMTDICFYQLKS